jgi:hypothetical protein
MKASELRIGNKVLFSENGKVFTVFEIAKNGIVVGDEIEYTWIEIDQFEGIKLTEEWLLKFNFEKSSYGYESEMLTIGFDFRQEKTGVKIEYVHQLQNLYFALTGNELEIK